MDDAIREDSLRPPENSTSHSEGVVNFQSKRDVEALIESFRLIGMLLCSSLVALPSDYVLYLSIYRSTLLPGTRFMVWKKFWVSKSCGKSSNGPFILLLLAKKPVFQVILCFDTGRFLGAT